MDNACNSILTDAKLPNNDFPVPLLRAYTVLDFIQLYSLDPSNLMGWFFLKRFYLFLERGEGRDKEKERNTDMREKHRSVASGTCPNQGLNLQLRHVSWLGIKPVTFHFEPTETHWSGLILWVFHPPYRVQCFYLSLWKVFKKKFQEKKLQCQSFTHKSTLNISLNEAKSKYKTEWNMKIY